MKPTVYVETTIISCMAARPSRDLVAAAWQQATREWWADHRSRFDVCIAEPVLEEIGGGDPTAAAARLNFVRSLRLVEVTAAAIGLADRLVAEAALPSKAAFDSMRFT